MRLRKTAFAGLGLLALTSSLVVENRETIDAYSPFIGDNGTIAAIDGCPDISDDELSIPVQGVDDVRSAARNFESAGVRPIETLRTITSFFDYPQSSYTSEQSGVEFVFYSGVSEAEWEIDHQAFDALFHLALTDDHEYDNPGIEKTVNCLRERIIDNQEFAGEEYSIYIPSNPRSCLGNGRIIDLDKKPDAKCHQRGFAPPKIAVSLFGLWQFDGRIMILTGGRTPENTQSSMQKLAFHESIHALTALPGEVDFQLEPNEKWVKYQERTLLAETPDIYEAVSPFITFTNTTSASD